TRFVEGLYSQSVGSSTLLSTIRNEIFSMLKNIGYIIEDQPKIIDSLGGKEKIRGEMSEFLRFSRMRHFGDIGRRRNKEMHLQWRKHQLEDQISTKSQKDRM